MNPSRENNFSLVLYQRIFDSAMENLAWLEKFPTEIIWKDIFCKKSLRKEIILTKSKTLVAFL